MKFFSVLISSKFKPLGFNSFQRVEKGTKLVHVFVYMTLIISAEA